MHALSHAFHGGAFFEAIGLDFQTLENRDHVINADVLDAWYPPSPNVMSALSEHLEWLVRTSPPTRGEGLRTAIANARGVDEPNVLVGAGTSNLMYLAFPRLIGVGSKVTLPDPTYGEYRHLAERVLGARVTLSPLDGGRGFVPDVEQLAYDSRDADLVVLVNPNSPTGVGVSRRFVQDLLLRLPEKTVLWVDETYIDFLDSAESAESLVSTNPRLIVSKSMSKFYAMSGLRVGYLVADPSYVRPLDEFTPPWSVGLLAQVAAVEALRDVPYYQAMRDETHVLRQDLADKLEQIEGVRVFDSVANYLLMELASNGVERIVDLCKYEHVFLRNCASLSPRFGDRFLRTAVKNEAANQRIVEAIAGAVYSLSTA